MPGLQEVRIRFQKTGRAAYISHLDLNRYMMRALRRAGLPLWYTQGYNPHPYLTFALPLSIFYESDCEIMDFRLEQELPYDEIRSRLVREMPEGLTITEVCVPEMKYAQIALARYDLTAEYDAKTAETLVGVWQALVSQPAVEVDKRTKSGVRELEIGEYVRAAEFAAADGRISLCTTLPATPQETVNPSCFPEAIEKYAALRADYLHVRRTGIFDEKMQPFR